jgi:hypothetical protein
MATNTYTDRSDRADRSDRYGSLLQYADKLVSELADNGIYYDITHNRLTCSSCKLTFEYLVTAKEVHKQRSPGCRFNTCDMHIESRRRSSFHNWPAQTAVPVELFNQSGLYYSGHGDLVICAFCNGRLNNWQINDHPVLEHAKWFPTCSYVRGTETRNIHDTPTHSRESGGDLKCKICLSEPLEIMVLPCNHITSCSSCIQHLQYCVVCRGRIAETKRVYIT